MMRERLSRYAKSRERRLLQLAACAGTLFCFARVQARPTAPALVCQEYSAIPDCSGKLVSCNFCHVTTDPPAWNGYGMDIRTALDHSKSFEDALAAALHDVEDKDSDGDGVSNRDELAAGTAPGDMLSVSDSASSHVSDAAQAQYDLPFAFRRVHTLYCGQSPTYKELNEFREAAKDEQEGRKRLHEALDKCLSSDYWQKDALLRLADKRIKPQASLGPDTQLRLGKMRPVLGDYHFDYRLWRFIMTNGRDMRELLTADYHVLEADDGTLTQTRELIPRPDVNDLAGGQPLQPEYRAGMITTQWFLHSNTMVSALPRTTAAQAYRAYLGADISAMEGLIPVAGEPVDIDHKGVKQTRCAGCHSTLDPLAYAFAKYEGAPGGPKVMRMTGASGAGAAGASGSMASVSGAAGSAAMPADDADAGVPKAPAMKQQAGQYDLLANIGGYNANRPFERIPGWDDAKQRPYVLGQQVDSLVELAQVAVASDQFKRTLADMFFRHALGAQASLAQAPEFDSLWKSLPEDNYSANRLLHRLVDTNSFGAP